MKKTIILIHGWDPKKYNYLGSKNAWDHRKEMIELLKQKYEIIFCNLPGFCGIAEPKKESWNLDDFSNYLESWILEKNIKIDAIVGYSFGGAILAQWNQQYNENSTRIIKNLFLISPAIKRRETIKSFLGNILGKLFGKVKIFKHIYLYTMNKYYRNGTAFLRKSYDKIAREDIRPMLDKNTQTDVNLIFIYGKNDSATPFEYLKNIQKKSNFHFHLIEKGGHSIGQTHPQEIVSIINNYTNENND